ICIGCSILYGKDQSSSQQSISNSYAAASTILELMIIHHKQLFTNSSQQEQTSKSFKCQPDLIPTEFHSIFKVHQDILNRTQLDRPGAPSLLISTSPTVQPRQKLSFPLLKTNNEQKFSTTIEDKTIEHESTTDLSTDSTSTTNDGVNVGKSNNNRISSFRNSTLPSPGIQLISSLLSSGAYFIII
ncbi:unnamed protein product, partial [Rotaria sp. Silwood1]